MQESARRDRLAAQIYALCSQVEEADRAYRKADLDDDDEAAVAHQAEIASLQAQVSDRVAEMARLPIRNEGDLARRCNVLLAYLKAEFGEEALDRGPVAKSIDAMRKYAENGLKVSLSSILYGILPSLIL